MQRVDACVCQIYNMTNVCPVSSCFDWIRSLVKEDYTSFLPQAMCRVDKVDSTKLPQAMNNHSKNGMQLRSEASSLRSRDVPCATSRLEATSSLLDPKPDDCEARRQSDFGSNRFTVLRERPDSSLMIRRFSELSDISEMSYPSLKTCAQPNPPTVVMVDDARIAMVEHMYRSNVWDLPEELKLSTAREITKIFLHAIGHMSQTDPTAFSDSSEILEFVRLATHVKKQLYV
jgi:hypothetical protein